MFLKESFSPFYRDALTEFSATPPCSVQVSLSSLTAPCDAPSINVHSAHLPLMCTGKAESAQITH